MGVGEWWVGGGGKVMGEGRGGEVGGGWVRGVVGGGGGWWEKGVSASRPRYMTILK